MKHLLRLPFLSLMVFIVSLFVVMPARAFPSMPSSFYGTVKVNGANVAEGTLIQALIGGQVYAEAYSQMYQGDSVFALDVKGDDSDTAAQDGGREGDAIQFKIGGVLADQTAVWHSGTNVNLNLTASPSGTISTPQATPTAVPTQTAIVLIQPTSVPPTVSQPLPTSANAVQPSINTVQPSGVPTRSSSSASIPAAAAQPSPTVVGSGAPDNAEAETQRSSGSMVSVAAIIMALAIVVVIGFILLALRKKSM